MSQNTVDTYLNLITSQHRQKPNFTATITAAVSVLVQIQTLFSSMIELFDLDQNPVGNQLDIIGDWVGVSRQIATPIPGVFFTWDDEQSDGWDFGVWQPNPPPSALIVLPDDIYLVLINATILINNWDGTTKGIYNVWAQTFPQYSLLIQDLQNMSFIVAVQGTVPDSVTAALLAGGYLVPRPEGIKILDYVLPVDTNPLFAWDCDSIGLQGWDSGSWGNFVTPN